jgi:hypothetical protein
MATYTQKRLYAFPDCLATPRHEFAGLVAASASAAIERGQVMAFNTSTNKWVPYANSGSNGTGTPLAILAEKLDASASDYTNAMLTFKGPLLVADLVGYDANAIEDFGALITTIPGDTTVAYLRY